MLKTFPFYRNINIIGKIANYGSAERGNKFRLFVEFNYLILLKQNFSLLAKEGKLCSSYFILNFKK